MKKYTIIISKQAEMQLQIIRHYISHVIQAPNSAQRILDLLSKEIQSLEYMPERIRVVEGIKWEKIGLRKYIVKKYYIYFTINEEDSRVYILAIKYNRRNQDLLLENLLEDDEENTWQTYQN